MEHGGKANADETVRVSTNNDDDDEDDDGDDITGISAFDVSFEDLNESSSTFAVSSLFSGFPMPVILSVSFVALGSSFVTS